MKTLVILLASIMIATGAIAKKSISGNSNTFLETYQITQVEDNLFELSYANSTEKFTIEVCPKEEECCYLLRGKDVEVMYLCNDMGFGLRKMPDTDQQISTKSYCTLLNNKAFKYQALLTPKQKSTKKALGLIACFFPDVINADSRQVVFTPSSNQKKSDMTAQN